MVELRPAVPGDLEAMVAILERAFAEPGAELDLAARIAYRRPLYEHLQSTAESSWIALDDAGAAIGYARATLRDGVRELTEFFVLPEAQGAGIGRDLLARAFPAEGARRRVVIGTSHASAIVRYLKSGVIGMFPVYSFSRRPEPVVVPTDLRSERIQTPRHAELDALAAIDRAVLDLRRDVDHAWLATRRRLSLWWRGTTVAAYGYSGELTGPFAALDPRDLPALLADAESRAAADGVDDLEFEVPLTASTAVGHLLDRGYRLHPNGSMVLADPPFGRFDRYVLMSPPFFL